MVEDIVITGMGVVSAIGVGIEETLSSLLTGETGVGKIKYLDTIHTDIPVGEVKMSNEEMAAKLGLDDTSMMTRNALIGIMALREAIDDAGLSQQMLPDIPLVSGTTVGGMDRREQHAPLINSLESAIFETHNSGDNTEMIADACGQFKSLITVSTACSSAANAIIMGANMLRSGLTEKVIVGGVECITKFHLNGFNTLMILDEKQCKPFDKERGGLNLGEGAAYMVLETASAAMARNKKPICKLSGYGNRCDAFHQTASSPDGEGAYLAMPEALESANLSAKDIDYINAHGTGTLNNDESETAAIKRVFGKEIPPMSATKSFTGHTTSASGAIESVFCALALQHQFLPINLNWGKKMEDGITPVTDMKPNGAIKHILCNAFGFGGNDSALVFSSNE